MPCIKCSNGKYKYGERGRCQFDTLEACHAAEAAIHARDKKEQKTTKEITNTKCCEDRTNCGDCNK